MFGDCVKSLQDVITQGLCEVLLCSQQELPSLTLKGLREEMGNNNAAHNFTNSNVILFRSLRSQVLTRIRKKTDFSIRSWFNSVDGLVGPLLTLIHIAAGMPGRATEYVPLLSMNDKGHRQRSVYLTMGRLCFVFQYNKADAQTTKSRVIARFLDPLSSQLWLWFLGVIQPMYW
jgi:hypothetical protein